MKKNNWLKNNWWWCLGIPALFGIPFILNCLLALENPTKLKVIGEDKDWLLFWATYITGGATLIIIYFNMRYHKELKTLQINTLKYTQKQKWLDTFREKLQDNISFLNIARLKNAIQKRKENPRLTTDIFDELFRETMAIPNQFTLMFSQETDEKEKEYLNLFQKLSKRYADIILLNIRIILTANYNYDLNKCKDYLMITGKQDKQAGIETFSIEEYKKILAEPTVELLFKTINDIHDNRVLEFLNYYQSNYIKLIYNSQTILTHEENKINELLEDA